MSKKLTIEFIRENFRKENYTLLDTVYINNHTKLNYICPNGHKHSIQWNSWQYGHKCPTCAGQSKPSIEFVKESFEKEGYVLLSKEYVRAHSKLNYICSKGHKHSICWHDWNKKVRCPTCYKNSIMGQGNPRWKGGVRKQNVPLYDTYHHQLSYCEETRRDPDNLDLLQVKCTKCNKFFSPTLNSVRSRIASLNNHNKGELKFYCSDECKHSCSIYKKQKYSADEKRSKVNPNFTTEELKAWSKEVLKRANNTCEYCSAKAEHAHHIQPKKIEPFYALDPDNGVACCERCHQKHGHSGECSTGVLASTICN